VAISLSPPVLHDGRLTTTQRIGNFNREKDERVDFPCTRGHRGRSATLRTFPLFPRARESDSLFFQTTITTPPSGYQYVPIETVEPGNDCSLEPWTDCLVHSATFLLRGQGLWTDPLPQFDRLLRSMSRMYMLPPSSRLLQRLHNPSSAPLATTTHTSTSALH
jgi:hypothetical protein